MPRVILLNVTGTTFVEHISETKFSYTKFSQTLFRLDSDVLDIRAVLPLLKGKIFFYWFYIGNLKEHSHVNNF
jgi:hypothetical protein